MWIKLFLIFLCGTLGLALLCVFGTVLKRIFGSLPLWFESKVAGAPISLWRLLIISFEKLDARRIFETLKMLRKAGVTVTCPELEAHLLAGGNLDRVCQAAVAVDKAGLAFGFQDIARFDLAGRDVAKAVHEHINPIVLECPAPGTGGDQSGLVSVAGDGVALGVRARITVRTRLDKLVGGASEQTILARVGEGIVTVIGRAKSHRDIVKQPALIAEAILAKHLDEGTCYEILSLDIGDVDILENVAARLQSARADADKRIARARAEERRVNAVANAVEMRAKTVRMDAAVTAEEAVLPHAVAMAMGRKEAFRTPPMVDLKLKGML